MISPITSRASTRSRSCPSRSCWIAAWITARVCPVPGSWTARSCVEVLDLTPERRPGRARLRAYEHGSALFLVVDVRTVVDDCTAPAADEVARGIVVAEDDDRAVVVGRDSEARECVVRRVRPGEAEGGTEAVDRAGLSVVAGE